MRAIQGVVELLTLQRPLGDEMVGLECDTSAVVLEEKPTAVTDHIEGLISCVVDLVVSELCENVASSSSSPSSSSSSSWEITTDAHQLDEYSQVGVQDMRSEVYTIMNNILTSTCVMEAIATDIAQKKHISDIGESESNTMHQMLNEIESDFERLQVNRTEATNEMAASKQYYLSETATDKPSNAKSKRRQYSKEMLISRQYNPKSLRLPKLFGMEDDQALEAKFWRAVDTVTEGDYSSFGVQKMVFNWKKIFDHHMKQDGAKKPFTARIRNFHTSTMNNNNNHKPSEQMPAPSHLSGLVVNTAGITTQQQQQRNPLQAILNAMSTGNVIPAVQQLRQRTQTSGPENGGGRYSLNPTTTTMMMINNNNSSRRSSNDNNDTPLQLIDSSIVAGSFDQKTAATAHSHQHNKNDVLCPAVRALFSSINAVPRQSALSGRQVTVGELEKNYQSNAVDGSAYQMLLDICGVKATPMKTAKTSISSVNDKPSVVQRFTLSSQHEAHHQPTTVFMDEYQQHILDHSPFQAKKPKLAFSPERFNRHVNAVLQNAEQRYRSNRIQAAEANPVQSYQVNGVACSTIREFNANPGSILIGTTQSQVMSQDNIPQTKAGVMSRQPLTDDSNSQRPPLTGTRNGFYDNFSTFQSTNNQMFGSNSISRQPVPSYQPGPATTASGVRLMANGDGADGRKFVTVAHRRCSLVANNNNNNNNDINNHQAFPVVDGHQPSAGMPRIVTNPSHVGIHRHAQLIGGDGLCGCSHCGDRG